MAWIEEEITTIIGSTPVASIFRHKEKKEDYTWFCNVDYWWGHGLAILKAASRCPTFSEARLVKRYLKTKGIRESRWERRTGLPRLTGVKFKT